MVCSGLFDDDTENPDDYVELPRDFAAIAHPMICANPDHLVERGDKLVYCAGALRAQQLGGNVVSCPEPARPPAETDGLDLSSKQWSSAKFSP